MEIGTCVCVCVWMRASGCACAVQPFQNDAHNIRAEQGETRKMNDILCKKGARRRPCILSECLHISISYIQAPNAGRWIRNKWKNGKWENRYLAATIYSLFHRDHQSADVNVNFGSSSNKIHVQSVQVFWKWTCAVFKCIKQDEHKYPGSAKSV